MGEADQLLKQIADAAYSTAHGRGYSEEFARGYAAAYFDIYTLILSQEPQ